MQKTLEEIASDYRKMYFKHISKERDVEEVELITFINELIEKKIISKQKKDDLIDCSDMNIIFVINDIDQYEIELSIKK
ncbi:MAG: hypothetical protein CME69_12330 [Halobacteriovorax sp.]|nr:hypothetical protein [Halobacteriovorax sp.]|tara:strand:- start:100 stop:336 length:237 start_codon:yes stop_codon:yes gene_type:complete